MKLRLGKSLINILGKSNKLAQVNNNLHHTKTKASGWISFPSIAVNPNRRTAICNFK